MRARRPPRRVLALVAAASLVLIGTGCGGGSGGGSNPSGPGQVTVKDNFFDPASTAISVGDTVTWTWRGVVTHNVISRTGEFQSKTMKSGTFEHTFEKPGTYEYHCNIHTGMDGKVVVS